MTDVAASRPGLRAAGAALRIPEFRRFWIGALISNSGSWMQNLAVPFVLFELTGSAAWVGIGSFLQYAGAMALGPLGGSLADRYPRRSILVFTQSGMAVVTVGLWALWASGAAEPWSIAALVALFGAVAGINIASWQAFVTDLVPRELMLNAVTLNSAQFNGARAFGPAVGGLVLGTLGVGAAFALNAVSFLAVLWALAGIPPKPAPAVPDDHVRPSVWRETVDAVRYIRTKPGIAACCTAIIALGLLGQPVFPFLSVFAEEVFEVDGFRFGLLGAALGLGGVLAAPLVAGPATSWARSAIAGWAQLVYGLALVLFAATGIYDLSVFALVVAGGAYLANASTMNTTIQLQVDPAMRGKVLSLYVMGLTASFPVGSLVQGAVAEVVGVQVVTAVAGAALVVVVSWMRFGSKRLVHLDDEPVDA